MHAKKITKVISKKSIVLPDKDSVSGLAKMFGISENTVKGYLSVSDNRCAPKAIELQVAAINIFGGRLVNKESYETGLVVYDDDQTIAYEL